MAHSVQSCCVKTKHEAKSLTEFEEIDKLRNNEHVDSSQELGGVYRAELTDQI